LIRGALMALQNSPIGMIRHDELLNALLAIWKTHKSIVNRHSSEFSRGYQLGFEEGLDAIAQAAGLIDAFESSKASHLAKYKTGSKSKIEVIDGKTTFVDS
jgi:hypothetical protein